MRENAANTVDEYIAMLPEDIQLSADKLRELIKKIVPDVQEVISYQIPMYKVKGKAFIGFAVYKNHYGLYPTKSIIFKKFEKELSGYKQSAGTIQFPIDQPLPFSLIKKIIIERLDEVENDALGY